MKGIVVSALLLLFMVLHTVPSAAMMNGGDGHMQGGHMSREPREQPRQIEPDQQLGHRHDDYYHSHEGGNLPHSHDQHGALEPGAPDQKATPPVEAESSKTTDVHPKQETVKPVEQPDATGQADSTGTVEEPALPTARQGQDDTVMRLIPGGIFAFPQTFRPNGAGEEIAVEPFYMDETPVTNHQYVEFLNRVLADITVENGVVHGRDENIWLLLGAVKEGYEPIVYVNGKFMVQGAHHAACAVLRVTAYGASAYAEFFGKRLPAELEWIYAASSRAVNGDTVLPIPSPVMLYPANELGIRGLNSNVGEWTMRKLDTSDKAETGKEFILLGGINQDGRQKSELGAGVRRYPWEAFANVGFRCVVDVHQQRQKL